MKFNKSGQRQATPVIGLRSRGGIRRTGSLLLVIAASLGVATLLSACGQLTGTLTVDFVYVTSAKAAGPDQYGEIDVFEINSQSGHMRQIPTSPFPSGGRNPIAEAVSSDFSTLYVVNRDDNTIVQFTIGNDGKVYPQNTVNTPGIFPVATAVSGSTLFVADTYQPLPSCSPASPCPGSVAAFPIKKDHSLDAPFVNTGLSTKYWPLIVPASPADIVLPTGIKAVGSNLFVSAYDSTANTGYVFGFAIGTDALTPLNGGAPFAAGIHPSALAADPGGTHLYVTDIASNDVIIFSVTGSGISQVGNAVKTGNQPSAIVVDAKGALAYVANSLDSNVTGYSISGDKLTSIGTFAVDTQPMAIGIDPALNKYLFTANFLANTVSGFQIDAASGNLVNSQFSPFTSNANPTAVAAIPHGAVAK